MGHDMKMISILGSTGSIGVSSLNVISALEGSYKIFGLSCNKNISLLYKQIKKYNPKYAVITNQSSHKAFIKSHGTDIGNTQILYGDEGLDVISTDKAITTVIAAIVGFSCIHSVIRAIDSDKTILIANKEILVSAGDMIISHLKKSEATILPIDLSLIHI